MIVEVDRAVNGILIPPQRELDAAYTPFPPFMDFQSLVQVNSESWDFHSSELLSKTNSPPDLLSRAKDIAVRAAAVETGAIENLYETDRGFTFTVATEAATWETVAVAKGQKVRNLIESQLHAYDYIIDLATRRAPVSEMWIRTLHQVICAAQETFFVETPVGAQEQVLPKGQYKTSPNHVIRMDGSRHAYAPVDLTAPEMARLIGELTSDAFESAHPMLQAAYSHFAFVAIHPFADGNGRVARALASVYTYRASSIPLLIMVDHRARYFDALSAGDARAFQALVDFVEARRVDALMLVLENLRTAAAPNTASSAARLARLYFARLGLTHAELDAASLKLLSIFADELSSKLSGYQGPHISWRADVMSANQPNLPSDYRGPLQGGHATRVVLTSPAPAAATVQRLYHLGIPKAGSDRNVVLLWCPQVDEQIPIPIAEIAPSVTAAVHFRLSMIAERVTAEMMDRLMNLAEEALQKSGY